MSKAKYKNAFSWHTWLTLNENLSLTYDQYLKPNVLLYHDHSHIKPGNDAYKFLNTLHSLWVTSRVKPVPPKSVLLFGKLTENNVN